MNNPDLGKLVLRVALGFMILLHGLDKLLHGVAGIAGMLGEHGIPGFFAYGVYLGEVVGPLMLMLGWQARIGALLIAGNMLVAIAVAHAGEVFQLTSHGGWAIELQAIYLFAAVALVFLGPGRFALKK